MVGLLFARDRSFGVTIKAVCSPLDIENPLSGHAIFGAVRRKSEDISEVAVSLEELQADAQAQLGAEGLACVASAAGKAGSKDVIAGNGSDGVDTVESVAIAV